MGGAESHAESLAIAAIEGRRGAAMTIESLLLASNTDGAVGTAEAGVKVLRGLQSLHSRGLVEIDYWNNVTPLFGFDAERPQDLF